ncbi:MBL fold metallo-hydrolase [Candidatus Saccharibacteria bacterium]|nr:MBL fold metallo-hydrolase [Candidatus Saccharibacteria bacterium]
MISNNDTIIYESDDLLLYIYLIGYKKAGESIVVFLKTKGDGVVWSLVIDNYFLRNVNMTKNILEEHGFGDSRKLDAVCVTHFHTDHAKGMRRLLENFTDSSTKIILPRFGEKYFENTTNRDALDIHRLIEARYAQPEYFKKNNLFYNRKYDNGLVWNLTGPSHRNHSIYVESLLPTDAISEHYGADNLRNHTPNDMSIFIKLVFDSSTYLFAGDCTDMAMRPLTLNDLKNVSMKERPEIKYLKIPHHGSDTALTMLEYIEQKQIELSGVATCAYHYKATKKTILDRYNRVSHELAVTTDINKAKNAPYDFGICRYVFDAFGNIRQEYTQMEKNATSYC